MAAEYHNVSGIQFMPNILIINGQWKHFIFISLHLNPTFGNESFCPLPQGLEALQGESYPNIDEGVYTSQEGVSQDPKAKVVVCGHGLRDPVPPPHPQTLPKNYLDIIDPTRWYVPHSFSWKRKCFVPFQHAAHYFQS